MESLAWRIGKLIGNLTSPRFWSMRSRFGERRASKPGALGASLRAEVPPSIPRTPTSRGIATIIEVCSRNDLLGDSLLNQGISELKNEGTHGAQALAELIHELLSARSPKIGTALWAASKLTPVPELVGAVQDVLSAQPVTQKQSVTRFRPEIVGDGRIGWTDGTAVRIREVARNTLEAFGVQPKHDPDELLKQSVSDTAKTVTPEEKKPVELLITNAGPGKEHMRCENGRESYSDHCSAGRTRLERPHRMGSGKCPTRNKFAVGAPNNCLGFDKQLSRNARVGVWYLLAYPSAEGKEIARRHIPNEKDPESRELLRKLIENP